MERLKHYLDGIVDDLCRDCQERAKLNPLRVFDCKNENCISLLGEAPKLVDNLCPSCQKHFDEVRGYLDLFGRSYRVDGTLVRGFDYYTRTTFEYECARLGAQKGSAEVDGMIILLRRSAASRRRSNRFWYRP